MSLLTDWRDKAYAADADPKKLNALWEDYFAREKEIYKQLLANPKAEICAFKGGRWIRIAGELILDERFEAQKSMLDAHPNLRKMYAENDGNTAVFYFRNATATISSFSAEPETFTF